MLLLATASQTTAQPSVTTDLGTILGTAAAVGVDRFVGIPFALPPIGERRFTRAVENREPFSHGVLNASLPGAPCIQNPLGDPRPPGFEDAPPPNENCLFLNIWRPADAPPDADLPVMVFAFGGGLCGGYATNGYLNGSHLALTHGAIVVTASYRLGALGYLPLGLLPGVDFDGGGTGGMNGMYDMVVALRWVQRHIGAFGGRAADVTLFGQSSGSYLSCTLSISPAARSLFSRAILQSGPCAFGPPTTTGRGWGPSSAALGLNVTRQLMRQLNATTVAALRAVPAEHVQWTDALMDDMAHAPYFTGYFVDAFMLEGTPEAAWQRGGDAINPSALIVGHTSKDGTAAFYGTAPTLGTVPPDANQTGPAAYAAALRRAWGSKLAPKIAAQYPLAKYGGSAQAAFIQADADAYVICPSYAIARAAAQSGRAVWSYEFAHFEPSRGAQPSGASPPNGWGCDNGVELDVVRATPTAATRRWATHGADVHYVFGTTRGPDGLGPPNNYTVCAFDEDERPLARAVGAYWTSFAKSADPNSGCTTAAATATATATATTIGSGGGDEAASCAHWPGSAGGAAGATQMLVVPDAAGGLGPVKGLHEDDCAFWEGLFAEDDESLVEVAEVADA